MRGGKRPGHRKCSSLAMSMLAQKEHLNATARPVGPVDLESLNVTVVEQVMRVLNNTIAQLHTLLNQVNSIIDAMHSSTSDILLTLEKEINFDQVFVSLDTFWTNVGGQANDIVHRLQLAANSFEKQLEDASGPIKITLYCVGGCLTFIILTAAIVNICIIYHVTRNHFSADPGKSSKGSPLLTSECLVWY
ncbi:hypothetical protein TSMEX_010077 [Taenia solium]|eukprot:TsM_001142700 transcript=TsM_001142700 gene=TsM_001142700